MVISMCFERSVVSVSPPSGMVITFLVSHRVIPTRVLFSHGKCTFDLGHGRFLRGASLGLIFPTI